MPKATANMWPAWWRWGSPKFHGMGARKAGETSFPQVLNIPLERHPSSEPAFFHDLEDQAGSLQFRAFVIVQIALNLTTPCSTTVRFNSTGELDVEEALWITELQMKSQAPKADRRLHAIRKET